MYRKRNKIILITLALILVISVSVFYFVNKPTPAKFRYKLEGYTQGTTYSVEYVHTENLNFQKEVDSLLTAFNETLSTYIPYSEISLFNKQDTLKFKSPIFFPILRKAYEVYQQTKGAFDPTVMPLVQAYGFGPEPRLKAPHLKIDSLLAYVDFSKIIFDRVSVKKRIPQMKLDFTAITRGYAVDVVSHFLENHHVKNYKVSIGGEARWRGEDYNEKPWEVVLNKKTDISNNSASSIEVIRTKNKAVASAGSYQQFYIRNGKRFSHTIDPKTGLLVSHSLLSVTVVADDCVTADAFATAFMVLGLDASQKFLEEHKALGAYFIYSNEDGRVNTFITKGLENVIVAGKK